VDRRRGVRNACVSGLSAVLCAYTFYSEDYMIEIYLELGPNSED